MKIISLFSGCGGLDLGFEQAGFRTVWANEFDKTIWATFRDNFKSTYLDQRDIREIDSTDIPDDIVGLIGGPPCQSWSEAGAQRGIQDARGQLFYEYIRVLKDKQPRFFLAENVQGMLFQKHQKSLESILRSFENVGYIVRYKLLNTVDFGVPQDRKRVIFIGYHQDLQKGFAFPNPLPGQITLQEAIGDLAYNAVPALEKNKSNPETIIPNHEYMTGGFSSMYMSRNRVRAWGEPSFTIQAGGRHAPIHPQANKMMKVGKDQFVFDPESPAPYRRLSIRECARIQAFPDDFQFHYVRVSDGYKMVGNAVAPTFAKAIASAIIEDLTNTRTGYSRVKQTTLPLET